MICCFTDSLSSWVTSERYSDKPDDRLAKPLLADGFLFGWKFVRTAFPFSQDSSILWNFRLPNQVNRTNFLTLVHIPSLIGKCTSSELCRMKICLPPCKRENRFRIALIIGIHYQAVIYQHYYRFSTAKSLNFHRANTTICINIHLE